MDRRSFLGSVIGLVGVSPFYARLLTEPMQRVQLPFKMGFREIVSGKIIQAPAVIEIAKVERGYKFVAEKLEAKIGMLLDRVYLFGADDTLINGINFSDVIAMNNGDSFKCSVDLVSDIPRSLDELVAAFRSQNGKIRE